MLQLATDPGMVERCRKITLKIGRRRRYMEHTKFGNHFVQMIISEIPLDVQKRTREQYQFTKLATNRFKNSFGIRIQLDQMIDLANPVISLRINELLNLPESVKLLRRETSCRALQSQIGIDSLR